MPDRESVHFLRRVVNALSDWLDRVEKKPTRAKKPHWYQMEYHIPPLMVAILSTVLLFGIFFYGAQYNLYQYVSLGLFCIIIVSLTSLYMLKDQPKLAQSDDAVSLLAVLFIVATIFSKSVAVFSQTLPWISYFVTPIAIAPLLATLLLHPRLGIVLSFLLALVFGFVNSFSLEAALVAALGGVTIVASAQKARTAHHIARAGLITGFAQLAMVFIIAVLKEWSHQTTWVSMTSAFVGGILSAFFGLGALPFLESFFSRTSNLRLLELADVNHPLLRKMAIEAPGTYHHSMIVANLAADAAQTIGANSLLARAGAYYHDIGKMVKAEYFIENQGTIGNPHDEVSPSLSKLIITSHVKEGIALGKAYGLDQVVLDFIPQHHGTSQIEYFYQKALKQEEKEEELDKEEVTEETYRYPGPKPQSREAGIVMMSDSVEAASRTLEEPNHQRYKDMVYKIINKKLFDTQLNETPLTLNDLHLIAERFIATLVSINHARIPYPESKGDDKKNQEKLSPKK